MDRTAAGGNQMGKELARIGDLLDGVGTRLGLGRSRDAGLIWSRWPTIVGATISEHAEPSSLRDGVLRVRAETPAWAAELGYLGPDIKARANELIGRPAVVDVRVWTGPGPMSAGSVAGAPPEHEPAATRDPERSDDDPAAAFERARAAWKRRHLRGPAGPASDGR